MAKPTPPGVKINTITDESGLSPDPSVDDETKGPKNDFDPPLPPAPEEVPVVVVAPTAIDPTAVKTTESGLKYGWQQEATKPEKYIAPCMHTGIFQARKEVATHEIGHEWACACGVIFVVALNRGDKKVLKMMEQPVG